MTVLYFDESAFVAWATSRGYSPTTIRNMMRVARRACAAGISSDGDMGVVFPGCVRPSRTRYRGMIRVFEEFQEATV